MRRVVRWLVNAALALSCLALAAASPVLAQAAPRPASQGVPVVFAGDTLFSLYGTLGAFTAGERATAALAAAKDHDTIRSLTLGAGLTVLATLALLLAAARGAAGILPAPAPFVLQTSLDDFFVSYQINGYTDRPAEMARIYSDLHQAIQDEFNKAGVEICSPHFRQLRDGNEVTIPAEYRPKGYVAPTFRVSTERPRE